MFILYIIYIHLHTHTCIHKLTRIHTNQLISVFRLTITIIQQIYIYIYYENNKNKVMRVELKFI
jgi:hypothetical protein